MSDYRVMVGDVRDKMKALPDESVQCVVTSPPYWGLRDYGEPDQLGLEPTPEQYVENMVAVFREVRRVLRKDGTLWLNLGDSYAGSWGAQSRGGPPSDKSTLEGHGHKGGGPKVRSLSHAQIAAHPKRTKTGSMDRTPGLKPKDLVGIPWAVARALQQPYYTGNIKAECDRVWLAATIDGEGTITASRHERKDTGRVRTAGMVNVTNTSVALLDECARIWPASRCEHMQSSDGHRGQRTVYRWVAHGADRNSLLLRELYPHLIVKKKQALLAWNLFEFQRDGRRLGKSRIAAEVRGKREQLVGLIHDCNQGQTADVPRWCEEPPSLYEPGYYLRSDIIWAKPNPMPESVTDRPKKAHEYIFLLTKSARYYYDADAIREPLAGPLHAPGNLEKVPGRKRNDLGYADRMVATWGNPSGRNKRDVWTITTKPFPGAHFAVFPPELPTLCIKAGTRIGDTVLDPFAGAGTTGVVAMKLGRSFIGIELNPEYAEMARRRIHDAPQSLFEQTAKQGC